MPNKALHLKRKTTDAESPGSCEAGALTAEAEARRLSTDAALKASLEAMRLKFKMAASDGVEEAEQQERLIRKMLADARKAPRVGGEAVLREYARVAQLVSVFKTFLAGLATELSTTAAAAAAAGREASAPSQKAASEEDSLPSKRQKLSGGGSNALGLPPSSPVSPPPPASSHGAAEASSSTNSPYLRGGSALMDKVPTAARRSSPAASVLATLGPSPEKIFGYGTRTIYTLVALIWDLVSRENKTIQIDWPTVSNELSSFGPILTPRECQALWRAVTYGSADANADLKKKLTVQLAEEGSLELASDASDIDEEPERLGATADLYSFAYKRPAVLADADFADKELTKPVRRPAKHQTLTKPEQPP